MTQVRAFDAEDAVIRRLKLIFNDENVSALKEWVLANYKVMLKGKKDKLVDLRNQLASLNVKINSTVEILIDTPSIALKEKLQELEIKKSAVESEIKRNSIDYLEKEFDPGQLDAYFASLRDIDNEDRRNQKDIIENYICSIKVYPTEDGHKRFVIETRLDSMLGIGISSDGSRGFVTSMMVTPTGIEPVIPP